MMQQQIQQKLEREGKMTSSVPKNTIGNPQTETTRHLGHLEWFRRFIRLVQRMIGIPQNMHLPLMISLPYLHLKPREGQILDITTLKVPKVGNNLPPLIPAMDTAHKDPDMLPLPLLTTRKVEGRLHNTGGVIPFLLLPPMEDGGDRGPPSGNIRGIPVPHLEDTPPIRPPEDHAPHHIFGGTPLVPLVQADGNLELHPGGTDPAPHEGPLEEDAIQGPLITQGGIIIDLGHHMEGTPGLQFASIVGSPDPQAPEGAITREIANLQLILHLITE